jgi:hypothetical protein
MASELMTMNELDRLYIELLYHGLVAIRNASVAGDLELCQAASELLHEVPSLIGEANRQRHLYQALPVRQAFLHWIARSERQDVRHLTEVWFAPLWKRIDALLGIDPAAQGEMG